LFGARAGQKKSKNMRIVKCLNSFLPLLVLIASIAAANAGSGSTGEIWFGAAGPTNDTASGLSDDRIGHLNSDGIGVATATVNSSSNSYYSVAIDTNANLYFGLAADGTLTSGLLSVNTYAQDYSGTLLDGLNYIGNPGDAQYGAGATPVAQLYTADAGNATSADSPSVLIPGPFGTLGTFSATYTLLSSNLPAGTAPYWIIWVSAPGDTNPNDEIAIIQFSVGPTINSASTVHVYDPNGVIGTYFDDTLANLSSSSLGTYTFGDMTVDWAGVEIGDWAGVNNNIGASADIDEFSLSFVPPSALHSVQITDVAASDLAYSMAVDSVNHILYMGLWGNDSSGADLIKITYNPTNGQISSPYDPTIGAITNTDGVLLSFDSTGLNFVMARQMWVTPDGNQIYYVDNDFGDPGDFADGVKINGVYVVDTTNANPQPELLSSASQFPADNSQGYMVGLAVNPAKNLIYFATGGPAPGVDTNLNTIWSMPITGGTATPMPMPAGINLVYPNAAGGCLALDPSAQILYISDEGSGSIMQLALSAAGTSFTGGTATFFTLDSDHLTDGANHFPSAFVQGMEFVSVSTGAPQQPTPQLTLTKQGNGVLVSWPVEYSSYTLQSASAITTNGWSTYPGPFATNSTSVTATNVISGSARYFRLAY
jgi:hypothetical protein